MKYCLRNLISQQSEPNLQYYRRNIKYRRYRSNNTEIKQILWSNFSNIEAKTEDIV